MGRKTRVRKCLAHTVGVLRTKLTTVEAERDSYKARCEALTTALEIKHQVVQTLVKWRNETLEANRALCEERAILQAAYDRRGRHMVRQSKHLHETRQKLRKVEAKRDAHRQRCEALEWLGEVEQFKSHHMWPKWWSTQCTKAICELNCIYADALAATEAK